MFGKGTRLAGGLADRITAPGVALLIIGMALLGSPRKMCAQHGGGGGGRGTMGAGAGGGAGRPDGVGEKDDLKEFHRAIVVQASADQRAAFEKVEEYAQAAGDQLHSFRESLQKAPASSPLSDRAAALDQAIARARAGNQNFLSSFSSGQKSGLKEITNKLLKADTEIDKEIRTLGQIVQTGKPENEAMANVAASLDKELASFQNEQLALGGEMGILVSSESQDLRFNLPRVTNPVNVGGQMVSIAGSGVVSRTSVENGQQLFSVKFVANLSEVQQNVTGILRSEIAQSPRCGERIEMQQATLTPLTPASLVVAHLHFERWVCGPGAGSPMEMAAGDATMEVKLTPAVEQKAGLRLVSEITRVDAPDFLRDRLRSGDLGAALRDQIAAVLLSTMQKTADLKAALPPVAQESAILQRAQFESAGADQLNLVLEGQLQFSEEQAKQFAVQLKQRLSAQAP